MLHSEPSFCIYNSEDGFEEEHQNEDLVRSVTIGSNIEAMGSGEFSFGEKGMGLIEEDDDEEGEKESLNGFKNLGIEEVVEPVSPPMYLATAFGTDENSIGGGDSRALSLEEIGDVEEYYKGRVSEDPSNTLFLSKYAQLLQSRGDLPGAEEYYFHATLADPKDGEILLQYAKLVWELHHDQDKALSYFERAAHAGSEDSHILAAYASFLWEIDEDGGEDCEIKNQIQIEQDGLVELQNSAFEEEKVPVSPPLHVVAGLGIDVAGSGSGEEDYKRLVEENPCNPLFLRNYAQFLRQSKGDLQGAEEYYSRAILADPGDGETSVEYAKLVWELHHDQDKASCYFERAVQAAPGDSHVLAAYARFLWEAEEDEEHDAR